MSPVGGVGINLAIQDAVAAAHVLIPAFRRGSVSLSDLARIQARRAKAARRIQKIQVFIHNHILARVLADDSPTKVPWQFKIISAIPFLRRIPAYLIGIGLQPEHIDQSLF